MEDARFIVVRSGVVPPIVAGELEGWADDGSPGLVLRLVGNADLRAAEALGRFIRALTVSSS